MYNLRSTKWFGDNAAKKNSVDSNDIISFRHTELTWSTYVLNSLSEPLRAASHMTSSAAKGPLISIVVCTTGTRETLSRCLESIEQLKSSVPWELVIVINGVVALTRERVRNLPCACVRQIVCEEPTKGLGNARNCGWRRSTGEIVAFIDDDCYPASDYLENLTCCFAEDPSLGFIGGRVLLFDRNDWPITIQTSKVPVRFGQGDLVRPGLVQGANLAFRRAAIAAVGGFDPRFGHGALFSCEDIDIATRICNSGWRGSYDPRTLVFHHHGRKTRVAVKSLAKVYDTARGAYYAKCLRDPVLRKACIREWPSRLLRQTASSSFRELFGAAKFLLTT